MSEMTLFATAAFGLESVVARELQQLGYHETKTHNGYVEFQGDETAIAKCNLWLRCADRVIIKVAEFTALTFDDLFEGTKAVNWTSFLPEDACFPVEGKSVKSTLSSVPACQSIVKKAIVEKLKQSYAKQIFPESGPLFRIQISLLQDRAILTIDTTGSGLHKRGYRKLNAAAPIKETLAAGLIALSRWQGHRPFADPLCGSGTLAIEAALMARNIAPGIKRTFISESWPWIAKQVWQEQREQAEAKMKTDVQLDIFASDIDEHVLQLTKYHASEAGVATDIHIKQQDVATFRPTSSYGCIVTNPPYGERLLEIKEAENLYRRMGKSFAQLETWSIFVIAAHPEFEKYFGRRSDKKRKLYNGRIQTNLFQFLGPLPPRVKPSN